MNYMSLKCKNTYQEISPENKLFDLEYFDGPLKSVYFTKESTLCIFSWIKRTKSTNIWLKFYIHPSYLLKYIDKEIYFSKLMKSAISESIYIIEIDSDLNHALSEIVQFDSLDKKLNFEYYFDEDLCEDDSLIQKWKEENTNSDLSIMMEKIINKSKKIMSVPLPQTADNSSLIVKYSSTFIGTSKNSALIDINANIPESEAA